MEAWNFELEDDSLSDYEYDEFLDQLEHDTDLYPDCIFCSHGCADCLL